MEPSEKLAAIRRKTRQRLLFSLVSMLLYFSFVLNWTGAGDALGAPLGDSAVSGSLLMFASLIVIFIGLEILFLLLNRNDAPASGDE